MPLVLRGENDSTSGAASLHYRRLGDQLRDNLLRLVDQPRMRTTENGYTVCHVIWEESTISSGKVFEASLTPRLPSGILYYGYRKAASATTLRACPEQERIPLHTWEAVIAVPRPFNVWDGVHGMTILDRPEGWIDTLSIYVSREGEETGTAEFLLGLQSKHDTMLSRGEHCEPFGATFDLSKIECSPAGRTPRFGSARDLLEDEFGKDYMDGVYKRVSKIGIPKIRVEQIICPNLDREVYSSCREMARLLITGKFRPL